MAYGRYTDLPHKVVDKLEGLEYNGLETYTVEGVVYKLTDEGNQNLAKPIKFKIKLEATGEVYNVVTFEWELLQTINGLLLKPRVAKFRLLLKMFGEYPQIKCFELLPTDKISKHLTEEGLTDRVDNTEMVKERLTQLITLVKNENLKNTLNHFVLDKTDDRFLRYPAATSVHHAYRNGLAIHSIGVAENAIMIADYYQATVKIDRDVLITGAILHDLGKIVEYDYRGTRTLEGDLGGGHSIIGAQMVSNYFTSLGIKEPHMEEPYSLVLSCILSHHGEVDRGAAMQAIIPEACVISMADKINANLDAIAGNFVEIADGQRTDRLLAFNGAKMYKHVITEDGEEDGK
jgi:putative nucleotidyltransferase with HDIG domain